MRAEDHQAVTYKHVFSFASNGVIATDSRGQIVLINREARDFLGTDTKNTSGNTQRLMPALKSLVKR